MLNPSRIPISSVEPSGSPNDCAPPLRPKLAPWMVELLQQPRQISAWVQKYGSPLHVVVQEELTRNARDLSAPLTEHRIKGGLSFARKANKLPWFVQTAKQNDLGVDTASIDEVRETLDLGVNPEKIVITAIGKTEELISLAINKGCLLVIDNEDELNLVTGLSAALNRPSRIGLRFAGFTVNGRKTFSRFGFNIDEALRLFALVAQRKQLQLELLHAHLDRYDIGERASAARQLAKLTDSARPFGLAISAIDLGGGIVIRYLENHQQWEDFQRELRSSIRGERPTFTYLQDGLGYVRAGDTLIGRPDLYPVWNNFSKEKFITQILQDSENGIPLHEEFKNRDLQLFFEPGRALLDNTGMTFAEVMFRKRDTLGNLLIGLAMNRFNLRPFRAEFCSDPFVITDGNREPAKEGAFLVGCLCSECDTIFRRKLFLPVLPQPGDLIAFANTGGYMAHHLEVGTHGGPLPKNILIDTKTLTVQAVYPA